MSKVFEPLLARLPCNRTGRDYIIGDIHGHFGRVEQALERIGFDTKRDRLICVGDLVDRGPESPRALEWLAQPWFHAVMGNHDAAILHREGYLSAKFELFTSAHDWFDELSSTQRRSLADALAALPWALELETADGVVGVVHAEVPERFASWGDFTARLDDIDLLAQIVSNRYQARRAADFDAPDRGDLAPLADVDWVIHGHTPRRGCRPGRLGNRLWIDTMGWRDEPVEIGSPCFTLIDARHPLTPL